MLYHKLGGKREESLLKNLDYPEIYVLFISFILGALFYEFALANVQFGF